MPSSRLPFALPQRWPFCWWVAAAIDHYSRRVMGVAVFRKQPTGRQVRKFLDKTIHRNRARPKYIICDKGVQFSCKGFKRWCRRRKIKPRFGAIGKHGSIAAIERFIRTMKNECFRRGVVPLRRNALVSQALLYLDWYNRFRPHTFMDGRTPEERYRRIPSACRRPRFEPRSRWARDSLFAHPPAKLRGDPGVILQLAIDWLDADRHLPIVTLKQVA